MGAEAVALAKARAGLSRGSGFIAGRMAGECHLLVQALMNSDEGGLTSLEQTQFGCFVVRQIAQFLDIEFGFWK